MAGVGRSGTQAGRFFLISVTVLFFAVFLLAPLVAVFSTALQKGSGYYLAALADPETAAAVRLTLLTTCIAVPVNTIFGLCAGWAIARYEFPGKTLLKTVIALPFSVSPVIAGLMFILVYGSGGLIGPWLEARHIQVIFAVPGIILTTLFVTLPLAAHEVIAVLEARGKEEEEVAWTLGATGRQIFCRITLPKIKWGLFYGVMLSTARAMGEFGAVSVVSGHIRGLTNTLPLHIEILYNQYDAVAAFAAATLLALAALATLAAKAVMELRPGLRGDRSAPGPAYAGGEK
ncbi:MAG: sulfate/thiosulfate transport system permease protein [Moorella sp. (in: firmicutes)]|uniref:Sulfate transport system permease protein CysW n=1 Tax=Neomoorella thermoacetica TaxID=1525 RepID=A0A1J5NPZ7_NEOTH|nr:sulfate/thiosulfate transport system permease protein [Moorella sp. (in: firmicutes)]OIQ60858.1 sulfate transport system permease protein CysW [Moorella thermoacetica]